MKDKIEIAQDLKSAFGRDLISAIEALNAEGAGDVYAVAVQQLDGFFSHLTFVSNTTSHLEDAQKDLKENSAENSETFSLEYWQLTCDEWNRFDWKSFKRSSDLLETMGEDFYDNETPFDDQIEYGTFIANVLSEALSEADIRTKITSRHAKDLYIGIACSGGGSATEIDWILKAGKVLNGDVWNSKLRKLYGRVETND